MFEHNNIELLILNPESVAKFTVLKSSPLRVCIHVGGDLISKGVVYVKTAPTYDRDYIVETVIGIL